jgi:uncharacterized repeat protein (TIGR03837 family)
VRIVDNPVVQSGKLWDIFCRVIDNYGDIGVCWRLAVNLSQRGQRVRLWVDDASALNWMAPAGHPDVQVIPWAESLRPVALPPADIWLEAFGCEIAPEFIATQRGTTRPGGQNLIWINLEYLSAEAYVALNHGLPSPVMTGPGRGLVKYFFYPGFVPDSGGLLREADLSLRQARFNREDWLQELGIQLSGEQLLSLFCYEPAVLGELLTHLAGGVTPTRLLVTVGRASAIVATVIQDKNRSEPLWNKASLLSISYLPALTQQDYDHLLWACDLNFVRGEDSLVRALWAGKPLVWQIYPQNDGAHLVKLQAFLDLIKAPATLRKFHQRWNEVTATGQFNLPRFELPEWQQTVLTARKTQLEGQDLVERLLQFVSKKH